MLCFICRVQDLRELGELSPHWDNLRKEVMTRYGGIISSYQETLAELDKITGMSASFVTRHYWYFSLSSSAKNFVLSYDCLSLDAQKNTFYKTLKSAADDALALMHSIRDRSLARLFGESIAHLTR